jgi:hypothetical protein
MTHKCTIYTYTYPLTDISAAPDTALMTVSDMASELEAQVENITWVADRDTYEPMTAYA